MIDNHKQTRPPAALTLFITLSCLVCFCPLLLHSSQASDTFFREDFVNLDNWKPLYFSKIKKHSTYTAESDGSLHYLKAESHASASGLLFKQTFDVYRFPKVRWKWKVMNVYMKGDGETKAGDDYPMRLYILFRYDPKKAGPLDRVKYGLVKRLYGEYPPHSALNYVWAGKQQSNTLFPNPYTGKTMMIVLQEGLKNAGSWQEQDIDILHDYRRAFSTEPPATASIGIMNDSDNTGESSISYITAIEIYR